MRNVLKRSGAKDTDSFSHQFRRSRLILTVIYVAILAAILFSSATITRSIFSQRLNERFHSYQDVSGTRSEYMPAPPNAEDVRGDLLQVTVTVNGLLLLVAGGLSYLLAGITLRPIQSAYNRQRQFLSDASHELRTPLAILQTNLENERAASKTPATQKAIESHLEEVARMGHLVGDLLTLSRLSDEKKSGQKMLPVDLASTVRTSVDRLQSTAKRHGVALALSEDGLRKILVLSPSEDVLMEAMTNVIHNAIVYNKEGGSVDVSVGIQGKSATVQVEDTGVGIDAGEIKKVFDRFYRSEKSRSRQTGGSGLGLSIVQSIMHAIGGSIVITSEAGSGTVALLTFPIHKAS